MLITDKFIYIELHKTGCTHTRLLLKSMCEHTIVDMGSHLAYDMIPKHILGDFNSKMKVGNVRNPWDWYVSLWAFGCSGKGGLYHRVMEQSYQPANILVNGGASSTIHKESPEINTEVWKDLYSDVTNYNNFRSWLVLVLHPNRPNIGENFKHNPISKFAGLLTYRYLRLYTYKRAPTNIYTLQDLIEYDQNMNFMNLIIKNESINDGIYHLAHKLGYDKDIVHKILKRNTTRTNESIRERDYRKFYNDETKTLVGNFEQLIVDKYNYKFE